MAQFSTPPTALPTVLTVPGLNGSGPSHWQTLWEQSRPDTARVELGLWSRPLRNAWVTKLDQAIRQAQAPVVLAAHSLGCLAVAWWAQLSGQPYGWPVAGALLVAPADVDRHGAPMELQGFAPTPRFSLPFPSIVVASTDDPWVSIERAHSMAADWGSHFIDAGAQGHLNAASGIGWWEEGQELLERVISASGDGHGHIRLPSDARSVLAINATDAAQGQFLR
ncbi:esterase [Sphingomonas sp. Leaf24]|uniref:RBBP9/YdeN family alpha/beta hydrolase n=1 Tax=unclassified Sphingomonas TaxID=196159 RepID=UPI000700B14E|nr:MULTISPECIES: alpha/beta hydrolase [unclassified Sphingomonas]KQM13212.1 esterase [Sphingomonas sp. Leaf5]KQM85798.1 esterase [Sphingomonas sp. Leaf24]KQM95298.1 esterase [Sphingomonas sp. Leaf22]